MSRAARTTRVVYSAHNVEMDYATAKRSKGLHRLSGRQVGLLEGRAVHASDLVVACTDTDARRLVQLYGQTAIAVISNGFDEGEIWSGKGLEREEAREKLGLQPEELAILFVGGRALHNRRAVEFLEHHLLPGLRRPARLIIVGECARPRRDTHVLALGLVERLSPLLAAADVAVNPIESGSGSNVKLAEYLASGLPVVTTPIGLRGYEAYAHLVTVAELDAFLEAVDATNRRPAPSPEVAELSWNALGRRLYQVYADLLSRPHSPS
jgi:glycosyltransferase involved in cell wall biosynthesis